MTDEDFVERRGGGDLTDEDFLPLFLGVASFLDQGGVFGKEALLPEKLILCLDSGNNKQVAECEC